MYPYLLMYVSVNVLCSSIVECGSLCITYNVPTLIPLGFLRALTQTSHSVTNSGEANNRTRKARSQRARHECSRVRIQTNIFSMRTLFCLLVLNMKGQVSRQFSTSYYSLSLLSAMLQSSKAGKFKSKRSPERLWRGPDRLTESE